MAQYGNGDRGHRGRHRPGHSKAVDIGRKGRTESRSQGTCRMGHHAVLQCNPNRVGELLRQGPRLEKLRRSNENKESHV